MKKITTIVLLLTSPILMLNCQNSPTSSTSQPTASPSSLQLKWSTQLTGLFQTKCEEGLNSDKTVTETIDVKGACTCSSDEIVKRYPEGAQRFTGNGIANEDLKTLEDIGKDCALKHLKQK